MNTSSTRLRTFSVLFLAAGALALGACDDPTEIEDHPDAEGFALFEGGTEIYRYMLDDGEEPTLTLAQGAHQVAFFPLDHDGEFIPEEEDAHEDEVIELRITIQDPGVLTWTPEQGGDAAHTFVEFHGVLDAQPGDTSMEVCVPHEGHCDFRANVPVTVTAQ